MYQHQASTHLWFFDPRNPVFPERKGNMARKRRGDSFVERGALRDNKIPQEHPSQNKGPKKFYDRKSYQIRGADLRMGDFIVTREGYTNRGTKTADGSTKTETVKVLTCREVTQLSWSRRGTRVTINGSMVFDRIGFVRVAA